MASDGEDLSTKELLQRLSGAMRRPVSLVPIPESMLSLLAALIGKQKVASRLLDSLQVDISETRQLLDWSPVITVDEALRQAVVGRVA